MGLWSLQSKNVHIRDSWPDLAWVLCTMSDADAGVAEIVQKAIPLRNVTKINFLRFTRIFHLTDFDLNGLAARLGRRKQGERRESQEHHYPGSGLRNGAGPRHRRIG